MMQKQNWKCAYCYKKFDVDNKYLTPTLDHVNARSKWGSETDDKNIVLACFYCNMKKGNISLEKFLDWYICYIVHGREIGDDNAKSYAIEKKVRWPRRFWHKVFWYSLR